MLIEAAIILVMLFVSVVIVWFLTPLIVDWFLRGKYFLSGILIAAALFAGITKVIGALGASVVTALGDARDLSRMSVCSWLALAAGCAGAWFGSAWGLPGIVFGVACGWVVESLASTIIALPPIRSRQALAG